MIKVDLSWSHHPNNSAPRHLTLSTDLMSIHTHVTDKHTCTHINKSKSKKILIKHYFQRCPLLLAGELLAAGGCRTEESLFSSGKRPMLQRRTLRACVCVGGTQWIQWVINNKKKNKKLRAGRGSEKSRGKLGSIYNQNTSYTCMDLSKKKHVFVFRDLGTGKELCS